ncbi:MAG: DMT family transporter, partial [Bacteroidota bacterium]
MKIRSNHTDLLELNLAILFISTSGVLGRSIDLPVPVVIFFRALVAGIVLFLFAKVKGFSFKIARKNSVGLIVGGAFLGIHWVTYFYALKLSNVAIGMLSLYTFPTITAVLEPILLKKKFETVHLVMGLIVLVGIYLLAPDVDVENQYFVGMCLGVISAVFFSLRNIMLKSRADDNQS